MHFHDRFVARALSMIILCCVASLAACSATPGQPSPVAAHSHGPVNQAFAIGFRSFWALDPARSYRTAFDNGVTYGGSASEPRPLLVNIWYPAVESPSTPRMIHADYLRIIPDNNPALEPLAAKLLDYQRDVIATECIGAKQAEATPEARAELDKALSRPTPAIRNAPPAPGRYPIVLYHSGAGSSFEDNALLCERLASEGFIVIGSAFQLADGSSFNVDAIHAGRDIEFLLRLASEMPSADMTRIGAVGHSAR